MSTREQEAPRPPQQQARVEDEPAVPPQIQVRSATAAEDMAATPSSPQSAHLSKQPTSVQFNQDASEKLGPPMSHFFSRKNRQDTKIENATSRFVPHKYFIRRPRALQVEFHGEVYKLGDEPGKIDGSELESRSVSRTNSGTSESEESESGSEKNAHERSTDNIAKQRERLDLFTDLIWVGIVSNISEHFYEQAFVNGDRENRAPAVFIVLFLSVWQIWARLQIFLNSYYMDDTLQRILVLWVLLLGIAWGNNAPFIFSNDDGASTLICFYIVAIHSLVLTEAVYSIWIPWLRKHLLIGFVLYLPSTGMWVAAINTGGVTQFALIWGAVSYDKLLTILLTSPLSAYITGDGLRKAIDQRHLRTRYESFFIIALGEGIILLIRGSPLGEGITYALGRAAMVLTLYYALYTIYFNGDQSKRCVHPVHRRWYIRAAWQFIHVFYFGALILLSSTMLFLVQYDPLGIEPKGSGETEESGSNGESSHGKFLRTRSEAELPESFYSFNTLQTGVGTACVCLTVIMACNVTFALMTKSVDPPKTLFVNNKYIRLIPRIVSIPIFATVWLAGFELSSGALGTMTGIAWFILAWEWYCSMERGCKFIEPAHNDE